MPDVHLLEELLIVLAVTVFIVYLFQKARIPAIVGFLLAGVVIGPVGFGLIEEVGQVETLADIGLALLLFTIGIEFSLKTVAAMQRRILLAALSQVLLTISVVAAIAVAAGTGWGAAVFFGFLVTMSSTAIVLRAFQDRGEINALHGRLASGTLLFQDLCIVPMMLILPFLGQAAEVRAVDILWAIGKSILALALIIWVARKLLPRLLRQIALLRNREIFVLVIVLICVGTAWLSAKFGLSLALGALIAGLVISESELSHQVVADVLPLRDCFSGIFFISIGMLFDPGTLGRDWLTPVVELLLLLIIKTGVTSLVFWYFYRSSRLSLLLGLSLAQIGEFSFVLAKAGVGHQLLNAAQEQIFLAASILSMAATPFLIPAAHAFTHRRHRFSGEKSRAVQALDSDAPPPRTDGHVIIVGYGLNGQNLARVLRESAIPYRMLELDPELVRRGRIAGEPIDFGDGTRANILRDAGIAGARVLVIAISDPAATAHVVSQARRLRSDLHIIVRTRYVAEIEHLYALGANEVIPEEFETSVEIFARVLQEYHIPRNVISLQVDLIRREHYGALRGLQLRGRALDELSRYLIGATADIMLVSENSVLVGQSLRQIDLRRRHGVTLIAAVRDGNAIPNVGPEFVVHAGDRLVLLGDHKSLDSAAQLTNPRAEA